MHRLSSLATAVILFFCAHVLAQPSSRLPTAEQYRDLKATMQQFYDRGLVPSNIRKPDPVITIYNRPGEYDLYYCGEAGSYLGWFEDHPSRDPELYSLTELALRMVVWENDIRKLGVPEEVWRSTLNSFEASALQHPFEPGTDAYGRSIASLAAELNARNVRAGRSLPKFVKEGGCGGGEIQVHFALKPADGQLFLIPVFLYKLCQAQNLNPSDLRSCDRWKEVLNGEVSYASGDYMYMAHWSDGVVRCGSIGFNNFDKHQEGTIEITKFRSPECKPAW